jgi:hypothetical protein
MGTLCSVQLIDCLIVRLSLIFSYFVCQNRWKLSADTASVVTDLLPHRSPCRAVRFTSSGNLISVGKDKRLCVIDVHQGTITQTYKKAHEYDFFNRDRN